MREKYQTTYKDKRTRTELLFIYICKYKGNFFNLVLRFDVSPEGPSNEIQTTSALAFFCSFFFLNQLLV